MKGVKSTVSAWPYEGDEDWLLSKYSADSATV